MEAYLRQIMDLNTLDYKNCKGPQLASAAKNPLHVGDDLELSLEGKGVRAQREGKGREGRGQRLKL